jgi:hypothetical protein
MNELQSSPNRELIEALAAIEHEQWLHWSRATASDVSAATRAKWQTSWVKYDEMPDNLKEVDRVWARKVVGLLRERKLIQ